MNGRVAPPGTQGDLHHQLDLYLASVGQPSARSDAEGGLLFDTPGGEQAAAFLRPDGGVQFVACPGYLSADGLRGLNDADGGCADDACEAQGPLDRLSRDLVSRWHAAQAQWSLSVDRWEGAAHLSMVVPALPDTAGQWDGHLQAFEQACEQWRGRLQAEPVGTAGHAAMDLGPHLVRG